MKKILALTALLLFTGFAIGQIRVTPEGYPLFPKKPSETTMTDNDSIPLTKADGILRAISLGDFKSLLPAGGSGGTYTAGEGLNLNTDEFSVDSTKVILLDANSPELGIVQIAIGTNAQLDALPAPVGYKRLSFATDGDGLTPINSGDYLSKPEYDVDEDLLVDGVDTLTVGSPQIIDGSIQNEDIQGGVINLDKLVPVSQSTFAGRASGAGTGSLQQLTASSAKTILNYQADEVSVDDAGGHFSGNDLEVITQEIGGALNLIDGDGDGLVNGVENGTISANKIATNAVTNAKMADASVGTSELVNQAVTQGKISSGFYDEGTFNANLTDSDASATYSWSSSSSSWTKIGNRVHLDVFINLITTSGTPTGRCVIGNIPAAITPQGNHIGNVTVQAMSVNGLSGDEFYDLQVETESGNIELIHKDPSNGQNNEVPVYGAYFGNGSLRVTITYKIP